MADASDFSALMLADNLSDSKSSALLQINHSVVHTDCHSMATPTFGHGHAAAQHSTAGHGMAWHSTAQHSTAWHGTAQHDTNQHNAVLGHAVQHGCAHAAVFVKTAG